MSSCASVQLLLVANQAPNGQDVVPHICCMFADTACCQQLSAIQFSTNLPVLIANTGGVPVSNNSGQAAICTCGVEAKGNKGGDYNGTVKFETRGGTDTR